MRGTVNRLEDQLAGTQRRDWGVGLGVVVGLMLILTQLVGAGPARADGDPSQDVVRDLTVLYELDADGTLFVTETFQWDFGARNGLGFYRTLITRMGYGPDTSKARVYEYSGFSVYSPSGAPAEVWVENETYNEIRLAVGAPDGSSDTRRGVQTYVLTYEVAGTINAVRGQEGVQDQDELFYNVFNDAPIRVETVRVEARGPAQVVDVACYQGGFGDATPCDAYSYSGAQAFFGAGSLNAGEGLTIMAAFPAGTFARPGPILEDIPGGGDVGGYPGDPNYRPGLMQRVGGFLVDYWYVAAALWAGLLGGFVALRVRRGRDMEYVGLPPGVLPAAGQEVAEARMKRQPPVAVRFTPPDGMRPGEAELLEEETATNEAFSATLIDLAVRGYLTVAAADVSRRGKVKDWLFTLNVPGPPPTELLPYEDQVMRALFGTATAVRVSALRGTFATHLTAFYNQLQARSKEKGWFLRPRRSRRFKLTWGLSALVLIILVTFNVGDFVDLLFSGGLEMMAVVGSITVALVSLVLVWFFTIKAANARSATGRAYYEQIRGFREYLTTAEADKITWEAGEDIFSKYLPWAIIFGVADRWTALFASLAEAGRYTYVPIWYVGYGMGSIGDQIRSIGDSVTGLQTTGMQSLSYTPGSSGGSGSFGGGGFSGGGGGGGSFGGR